jgi:hypothetical protein
MGRCTYRSTFSWPWHRPLYSRGRAPVPIGEEVGWTPKPVWTTWRSKYSPSYQDSNSFLPGLELQALGRPVRNQLLYELRSRKYLNILLSSRADRSERKYSYTSSLQRIHFHISAHSLQKCRIDQKWRHSVTTNCEPDSSTKNVILPGMLKWILFGAIHEKSWPGTWMKA